MPKDKDEISPKKEKRHFPPPEEYPNIDIKLAMYPVYSFKPTYRLQKLVEMIHKAELGFRVLSVQTEDGTDIPLS